MQTSGDQGGPVGYVCFDPNASDLVGRDQEMEEEGVMNRKAHAPPSSRKQPNPSPTHLPARKKHDAVPPQILNTDPLTQIIGTEIIADVVIHDVETCALLDSGTTTDLMTTVNAEA